VCPVQELHRTEKTSKLIGETHTGWGEIFEHSTKMWACATHKQFTMQMVAVAIAKATWNWVRGKCEEAMREVLGAGRGVQAGEIVFQSTTL
jgi:hypothetical protein